MSNISGFGKILSKSVPDIHEKILLSLDYETFKNCRGVCKIWDDMLNTESLQGKAASLYKYEMERELVKRCREGNAEQVRALLARGVNPNCYVPLNKHLNTTPLWAATTPVAKILLEAGASLWP